MLFAARSALALLTSRERLVFWALVAARAIVGFLDVFGILLVGVVAALGATQFDGAGGATVVFGVELPALDGQGLLLLVLFVLGVFVIKALIAIGLSRALTAFVARIESRNAAALSTHLLTGDLAHVRRFSRNELQFALTESIKWTFTGLLNNIAGIVVEGFLLLIVAVAFFVVDPIVAVFALGYFALIVVGMQAGIARVLKRAGEDAAEGTKLTLGALGDTLDTYREITVLGRSDLYLERIRLSRTRAARSGAVLAFLGGMPRYVVETALILGVVVFVGQQLLTGQLASGLATLGVFLAGAVRIMGAILPLQTAVAALKVNTEQSRTARELLAELRGAPLPQTPAAPVGVEPPGSDAPLAVQVESVDYRYPGGDAAVLDSVSLAIPAGSFAAIIGPSGAGKTTLVELLLGLGSPTGGSVRIDGWDPRALRLAAPGLVSYVPQKPGLVSGSIADNVALGIPTERIDRERVRTVLAQAQLLAFVDSLPEGIDTPVGKQSEAFSGGQVQRIGLARALYVSPRLIVLDEATSGLDASTEAVISTTLRELSGELTIIVIAHRLSTVQRADSVVVLEAGRVVAEGDFATVRRTVPMVAEYVKLMSFDDEAGGPAA
ncbi:MAG: ABC transporter ATP-binding protein [Microcella pacifica]|uniref:ABC transporter ATP-binding protein n=1 Tax=Microcella pacifica TaxID=2591847 RepID=UPI00331458D9